MPGKLHIVIGSVGIAFCLTLALAGASPFPGAAQTPEPPTVTFSETIAPILYRHCVTCHRPGEVGPFSLLSYEDAAARGEMIAAATKARHMPPWHARGDAEFIGDRRLSDEQIGLIASWVAQGMPRGNPARMPALPQFTDGWALGEPDLVLEMPVPFDLPAAGHDVFRNFVLPTGLTRDVWIRAVELRPRARAAAHHALFAHTPAGTFQTRDGADGQPGFGGSMAVGFVPGQRGGSLGGWAVGGRGFVLPDGLAVRLPAASDFLLQMHFHPTGGPQQERARVGLYFADGPPAKPMASVELPALFGFGAGLDIPAGEPHYVITDDFLLPADVRVYSVYGHAHHRGKEMTLAATLPDGSTKTLLSIPEWDFNWQEFYTYREPIVLARGTRLAATITYDNSTNNPQNRHHSPQRVRWGLESSDEMGTVGLLMEVLSLDDEQALQKALVDRTQAAIQRGVADGTVQRYLAQQAGAGAGR